MPRLNRIVETALYVDDLERARAFYEDKLGLAPLLKTKTLFAYDVGGANVLLLFQRGASLQTQSAAGGTIPPHDGNGPLHIAFAIDADELPAWEARLEERGIAVEGRMQWERGGTSSTSATRTGICWSWRRRACGGPTDNDSDLPQPSS